MSSVKNFKNICFLAVIVLYGCGVQASYNEGEECYAEGGEFWRCEKTQYCDRTGEIPQCMAAGEICENSKDKGNDNGFGYCLPGASCQNGKCELCKEGQILCDQKCINPQNDRDWCGAKDNCSGENAGMKCKEGEICTDGKCSVSCLEGQELCGNLCVILNSDPQNCGKCGHQCPAGNACVDGECSASCLAGQELCGNLCVILNSDPQNCGKCGHQCPAGNACVDGECSASCLAGQELCGNACVTLESDSNNCGECGNKCPAGIDCIDGRCASSCESGQNMCGNLCVNLLIDAKHCGTCDTDCNHQFNDTNVRFIECLTGTCAITACNNNYSPSEDKTMCVRTSKEWNYNGLSKYDEPSSVFGVKYKIDKDRHCLTTSEWSTGYSFVAFYADNSNFSSEGYVSVKYRVGNASQFKQIVLYLLSNYSDNNQDLANAPRFSLDPTATEWTVFTQKLPQNQNNTLAVAIMAEVESRTTVLDIEYVKVYGR